MLTAEMSPSMSESTTPEPPTPERPYVTATVIVPADSLSEFYSGLAALWKNLAGTRLKH